MSDIQPLTKKAKSHSDTYSISDPFREIIDKRKESQRRYREQNREKLRMQEAERRRRRRIQNLQLNAVSSTSHINRVESNKEEISDADSQISSGLEGTQTSAKEENPIDRKRENKRRYRERNREILRQREADRRQRIRNNRIIAKSTSSHRDFIYVNSETITDDGIITNSSRVAGLEETQNLFFDISERNLGDQANENEPQISNNYAKFEWFEEDLKKPPAHANIINTITASIEQETEQDEEIPEIKIEIEEHNVLSEQFQENSTGDSSCADSLVTLVKSEPEDEPMPEEGLLVGQAPAANEAQDMESDACTYFGKYVAAELRNLPWTTRVVVQQEIQSCIAAAIIRNANESNNSDPTNADAAGLPH